MNEPKVWKECPECLGYGTLLQHPGSHKTTAHMGATGTDGWPAIPCPTCAAHWRGVDEAVKAVRREGAAFTRQCANAVLKRLKFKTLQEKELVWKAIDLIAAAFERQENTHGNSRTN